MNAATKTTWTTYTTAGRWAGPSTQTTAIEDARSATRAMSTCWMIATGAPTQAEIDAIRSAIRTGPRLHVGVTAVRTSRTSLGEVRIDIS